MLASGTLALAWATVCSLLGASGGVRLEKDESTVFRHLADLSRMVELELDDQGDLVDCAVFGHRPSIERVLRSIPEKRRKLVNRTEMPALVTSCHSLHSHLPDSHLRQKRAIQAIWPGTKWCGAGNIADHPEDLGSNSKADQCCKVHDGCDVYILAFSRKFGLFNSAFFTRSHCDCDAGFYNCLKAASTATASAIGKIFFNLLKPKCLKMTHPRVCLQRGWWFTCRRRGVDTSRRVMSFAKNTLDF